MAAISSELERETTLIMATDFDPSSERRIASLEPDYETLHENWHVRLTQGKCLRWQHCPYDLVNLQKVPCVLPYANKGSTRQKNIISNVVIIAMWIASYSPRG